MHACAPCFLALDGRTKTHLLTDRQTERERRSAQAGRAAVKGSWKSTKKAFNQVAAMMASFFFCPEIKKKRERRKWFSKRRKKIGRTTAKRRAVKVFFSLSLPFPL